MKLKVKDYKPGEIMRIIREWTELTQKGFAESMNISMSTVQYWEYGKSRYYFETLMKIAEVHGLEITIEKKN